MESLNTMTPTNQSKEINILSAKDFHKQVFPQAKWIIYNLFEGGTMNMLSAAPNNYKSWLTLDIAMSIATGSTLFGFFVANQQTVWIINEEDTGSGIQERMNILNKSWPEMPIFFSIQNQIKLDDKTVHEIISIAKSKNVEFIIFDSLRSIHDAEENSATEMQKIIDQIKKITNLGITVLFTHHNRKRGMFKSNDGEESRGSTVINAAVHGHISCEPKKEDDQEYLIIRQVKLKGAVKMAPFRLLVNLNKDGMPFIYQDTFNSENISHSKMVKKILELLKNGEGNGLNLKSLIAANIGGERTIRETLREMEAMKSVVSRTWGEVQAEELPTTSRGMTHNEKFFFLP